MLTLWYLYKYDITLTLQRFYGSPERTKTINTTTCWRLQAPVMVSVLMSKASAHTASVGGAVGHHHETWEERSANESHQ